MGATRKVLIVCPQCDGTDVGENHSGFHWVSRLTRAFDTTVLSQRFPGRPPPSEQLPGARVVEWEARPYLARHPRLNSTLKPWYPHFYLKARRWIAAAIAGGSRFDLMHQLLPLAMRYPSPCAGFSIPFIIGPVGGSVPTPAGFRSELATEPRFMRLRNIDPYRLRYDPLLRRTFKEAAAVLCCSPYVVEQLARLGPKRTELEYEIGLESLAPPRAPAPKPAGELSMLYVGRIVRTKGLRDAIRALARLPDLSRVSLKAAGAGEDLAACREEAERLGVAHRVTFLGRLPRAELEPLYRAADVFLFPSFRETAGNVLFESMRHGLPVITARSGGPGHIVTDDCGIRVAPDTPERYAAGLAEAIRRLAGDPALRRSMGEAARERIGELGLWERKLARVARIYEEVAAAAEPRCGTRSLAQAQP
jgi:glycosyltransferase involved in cell wall biosynthesis